MAQEQQILIFSKFLKEYTDNLNNQLSATILGDQNTIEKFSHSSTVYGYIENNRFTWDDLEMTKEQFANSNMSLEEVKQYQNLINAQVFEILGQNPDDFQKFLKQKSGQNFDNQAFKDCYEEILGYTPLGYENAVAVRPAIEVVVKPSINDLIDQIFTINEFSGGNSQVIQEMLASTPELSRLVELNQTYKYFLNEGDDYSAATLLSNNETFADLLGMNLLDTLDV